MAGIRSGVRVNSESGQFPLAESLLFVLLAAGSGTWIVAGLLLSGYRGAVIRAMQAAAGVTPEPPRLPALPGTKPDRPLAIRLHEGPVGDSPSSVIRRASRSAERLAWGYVAGAIGYAGVMASAWMISLGEGFLPARFVMLWALYGWPLALTLGLVLPLTRRERWGMLGGQLAIIATVWLAFGAETPLGNLRLALGAWMLLNGPSTLLVLGTLHRAIRSVGPMVLGLLALSLTGMLLGLQLLAVNVSAAASVFSTMGWNATTLVAVAIGCGVVLFGAVGVLFWRWLGHLYRGKQCSSQSLTIDALWFLFALAHPLPMLSGGIEWSLAGVAGFFVYWALSRIVWWALRVAGLPAGRAEVRRLLLLRVFVGSDAERGEDAFAQISKWWLRLGSVQMIAGPDLVTRQVTPDQFLDYISGNLRRRYVSSPESLRHRLDSADFLPDPDGRYRVTEFFCHRDTWKQAMRALADEADLVIMDLRGFGPARAGCLYELGHLLDQVDLRRVVLLIGRTTDRVFLEQSLRQLWDSVSPASPNRSTAPRAMHIVPLQRVDRAALRRIFQAAGAD